LGWFDDEDQCYFMHREQSRSKKPCKSSQFLDYVSLYSCGYGIEPKYALLASLKIILGFSVLFFAKFTFWKSLLGDALITKPELPNSTIALLSNNDSFLVTDNIINQIDYLLVLDYVIKFFNAIYFSAIIFLSQIPNDLYISGIWRFVVVFERISGWMLMALFIVVLTKKLIR
jgi:hypothetical protein